MLYFPQNRYRITANCARLAVPAGSNFPSEVLAKTPLETA